MQVHIYIHIQYMMPNIYKMYINIITLCNIMHIYMSFYTFLYMCVLNLYIPKYMQFIDYFQNHHCIVQYYIEPAIFRSK